MIGLGGDTIEIKDGKVFRNGVALVEPYVHGAETTPGDAVYTVVTLAKDEIYVLGDNRLVSLDSRRFGPIARSRIIGNVLLRFYPFNAIGAP